MQTQERPTILIVDDEEAILKLLGQQLTGFPYVVIPTTSPAEAVEVLRTRDVAVLLCDLRMPEIDGTSVLKVAREENPDTLSILLTGCADLKATIKAINEGGLWKYISKPWRREELVALVREAVERYTSRRLQQSKLEKLAREITAGFATPDEQDTSEVVPARPGVLAVLRGAFGGLLWRGPRAPSGRESFSSRRYRVLDVLGEGGMGTVYKAEDTLLGMPVAIKVLSSRFTRDRTAVAKLKAEARIAMQLSHRHIVRIHNLQKAGDHYFIVMEFVNGSTFRDILRRYGRLPLDTVLQVVQVTADTLAYAHRHNVLHRDLKPTNLMLSEDGVLKIIDFGVSCLVGAQSDGEEIIGTPVYMSPEHIRGEPLDNRTDVYSLGIIVYQLLTGHNPFAEHTTHRDVLEQLASGPPDLTGLKKDIRDVLARAVAPDRDARWRTVDAFAAALVDAANRME